MPEDRAALERLCRRFGIATDYADIWGVRHAAPAENLVSLLAAFDVDGSTDASVAAAGRAADAAWWNEAMPPVAAIAVADRAASIPLRLASGTARRWHIEEEGGRHHGGALDTAALVDAALAAGAPQAVLDGSVRVECRFTPGVALPAGYHTLRIDGIDGETLVIAAPPRCWRPAALAGEGRVFGPALQLYALRSDDNWGIGDFGDLARVVEQWGARGAGIVGLNPLHALFGHNPAHISPYSPSSRQHLNPIYIDVEAVVELRSCIEAQQHVRSAAFQERLERLRAAPLVDYPGVAAAKREVLELLYAHFRRREIAVGSERARAFRAFQLAAGRELRRFALFETLQARFHREDASVWGWPVWPEAWRDPQAAPVLEFEATHGEAIEFHEYLQWQAEVQLERAAAQGRSRGMAVGLYLDLAVSVDRAGADTWSNAQSYALEASVGAPPDEFNQQGQAWGLPPLRPDRLRAGRYRVFVETLRANMRLGGALRIDHVMGLMRLFWVPPGRTARDGAYVHYRGDELLAIVALESHRQRCLVIGEDLGTVLPEMREMLGARGVLSYRLLYFERDGASDFKAPGDYPRDALVAVATHDLPTLAGWWQGQDIELRQSLGLLAGPGEADAQRAARADDRRRLLRALHRAGQGAGDCVDGAAVDESGFAADGPMTPALAGAIHRYLAAAPSAVMMVQLEDALGAVSQANLPGTTDEHPNWRRKLAEGLDEMAVDERIGRLTAAVRRIRPPPRAAKTKPASDDAIIPRATYRLQLHRDFDFDAACRILPYLSRLGVSHVYCSPITRANPGSLHGYDVVAHDEISTELGGVAGFERFTAALREQGLGLLLDLVPNHMGIAGADNAWWADVLENGEASLYARHFDIDWHPLDADLDAKVLLPVLGDPYGSVLDRGELRLAFEAESGSFALRYHEHRFAIDVCDYAVLLGAADIDAPELRDELATIVLGFAGLPSRFERDDEALARRARDKETWKRRLAQLAAASPSLAPALGLALQPFDDPERLHVLLERQAWRLASWRVASDQINYRRFFDVNSLAALRVERRAVFEATQSLALELTAAGVVDGLRIDHPDGLRDPAQYFLRLQQGHARRAGRVLAESPGARPARPLYLVAEKISALEEQLPESWSVHGTTGYRFGSLVNGLFVDGAAEPRMDRIWRGFADDERSFAEHAHAGKRDVMRSVLGSELTVLASELLRIARADRRTRDHTFPSLRYALAEVTACLPVYRTYIVSSASPQDRRYIDGAVAQARQRNPAADASVFEFVRRTLHGEAGEGAPSALVRRALDWAVRFQQFSAPVAAKGVEDTAFYRYLRLVSLNDVGGDPARFGTSVRAFHRAGAERAAHWPHTLIATATHDHKRSADVRCRIDVLSEMPAGWRLLLRRWSGMNRAHRSKLEQGSRAPSAGDEFMLYQTLLGTLPTGPLDDVAWAAYRGRIELYMQKATREAKLRTSWTSPDAGYEAALQRFIGLLLGDEAGREFRDDLVVQAGRLAWFGAFNSLSTALLKFTSPGVPDIYQGHEVVNLTLVDPDNRRPVDYSALSSELAALERLDPGDAGTLLEAPHDGRAKLWLAWRLLAVRRERPELFRDGGYRALKVEGPQAVHVVAFSRRHGDALLVTLAGRLFARLLGEPDRAPCGDAVWGDTAVEVGLPDGTRLRNIVDGATLVVVDGRIRLGAAFARFPAAALLALG
ncbi:MAG: malto-oligosyltrehalose synthase [Caldimonas sp.]